MKISVLTSAQRKVIDTVYQKQLFVYVSLPFISNIRS